MERLPVRKLVPFGILLTLVSTAPARAQATQTQQPPPPKIDGPTVYEPVAPRVFSGDLRRVVKTAIWREGDPVREVPDMRRSDTGRGGAAGGRSRPDGNSIVAPPAGAPLPPTGSPLAFDGIPATGWSPPDTVGDVGPNHYIQMVNISFAIYDKSGTLLAGPSPINALWAGFGGACEANNNGDPIVRYDHLADRWMLTQFAIFASRQCIAISRTSDPVAGGWYLYDFPTPGTPDYPKITVWPDGYYMGTQRGFPGGGLDVYVFDRVKMLAGLPAGQVQFFVAAPSLFLQPSDLDGPSPPTGAPNVFVRHVDGDQFGGADRLELFAFRVNWGTPAASTFTPLPSIPVTPYDAVLCGNAFFGTCVTQPGTAQRLEGLAVWLMWRLQYRNFGTHESLVTNHTIDLNNTDRAGIRWYELRRVGAGAWTLFQEGTYAPDEGAPGPADDPHRWMGSIAMNKNGSIALGYSASSTTLFPSIRFASREPGDPAGQLPAPEQTLTPGLGSQTGTLRWGNYSSMDVDPVDDCTFWYTTEYYTATSAAGWRTRIMSVSLPSCAAPVPPGPPAPMHTVALSFGGVLTDTSLPLDSGPELSFRYRRLRFLPMWSGEFETGIVGTETPVEDGLLARLQGHAVFHPIPAGSSVQPFVLAGAGLAHFDGLNTSDSAFLFTFGGGVDFSVTPTVGFRVDVRGLTLNGMLGSGWTTSLHILFGGTWSF
jgi:hypothetical protein